MANDFVLPGSVNTFETSANNRVRIDCSSVNAGGTRDVRAMIFIGRGTVPRTQPGRWSLHFRGDQIADGLLHVWIERTAHGGGAWSRRASSPPITTQPAQSASRAQRGGSSPLGLTSLGSTTTHRSEHCQVSAAAARRATV